MIICSLFKYEISIMILCADPSRNRVRGSEGGKVPERYLVVRNDDLIRPKYLLVYSTKAPKKDPAKK